jgi:glutamine cyclotransferase
MSAFEDEAPPFPKEDPIEAPSSTDGTQEWIRRKKLTSIFAMFALLSVLLVALSVFLIGANDVRESAVNFATDPPSKSPNLPDDNPGVVDEIADSPSKSPTLPDDNPGVVDENVFSPPPTHFDDIATLISTYNILKVFNHDRNAFTQGLYYHNGNLVESTGIYGESLVRVWDPETGVIIKETTLNSKYFGEGLTWYRDEDGNDRYVQITWKEQTAFIYDTDLNLLDNFQYTTQRNEGWGIAFDPLQKIFYVSDGSAHLHVWNLQFEEIRKFLVTKQENAEGQPKTLTLINELEWDPSNGTILANIWKEDYVVRILPQTGEVIEMYDFSRLDTGEGDVLNGIAFHSESKFWITGKFWPKIFLIELPK